MNNIRKPLNENESLILSKPVITNMPDEKVRLSCDIKDKGEIKTLYYEVDKEYGEYLCYERSDAFIITILPYAMLTGQDIYCDTPVTETLLHNINEVLVPTLSSANNKFQLMKIHASTENTPIKGHKVTTGISLGIDSFYTILKNRDSEYKDFELNHLLNIRGPYKAKKLTNHMNEIKTVSKELNMPLTFIIINSHVLWKLRHAQKHVYEFLGAVYAMRKLVRTYYYSTAENLSKFSIEENPDLVADDYLLLLAYNFSTPDVRVLIEGMDVTRLEKILSVSNSEVVQKKLRVCIKEEYNCNDCFKCNRTLMEIDMLGLLDNFREVFDVDYYLKHKVQYFRYLIRRKDKSSFKPLYQYFIEKEPENMAKAEKIIADNLKEKKNKGKKKESKEI